MRMTWARKKSSPQAAVDRMHFVMWDFLKMLVAAILCGVAVSIAAAGITLLLSSRAEAGTQPVAGVDAMVGTPGALIVGAGCDHLELSAVDRDWYVRIDGSIVVVRVMQTWILPADAQGAAIFHVRLPRGAQLNALSVQSPDAEWTGRKMSADAYVSLAPARYLSLTRNRLLVTYSPDGEVATSPLAGLRANDAVVVQYSYTLMIDAAMQSGSLVLSLAQPGESNESEPLSQNSAATPALPLQPKAKGAIWVEWAGRTPARMLRVPHDASLERDTGPAERVGSLSWESGALKPGEQFRLAWLM